MAEPRNRYHNPQRREQNPRHRNGESLRGRGSPRRPRGKTLRWFFFACFAVVDVLAILKLALNTDRITVSLALGVISFITVALYKDDKSGSQVGAWRTSESLLHLLELAGGWPAAFIAQQRFRHKTVKFSYQFVFWLIGLLHLFLATEYLRGWPIARAVLALLPGRIDTP